MVNSNESETNSMEKRLNILRYGLIVIPIVSFIISVFLPLASVGQIPWGTAIFITIGVIITCVVTYFIYANVAPSLYGDNDKSEGDTSE